MRIPDCSNAASNPKEFVWEDTGEVWAAWRRPLETSSSWHSKTWMGSVHFSLALTSPEDVISWLGHLAGRARKDGGLSSPETTCHPTMSAAFGSSWWGLDDMSGKAQPRPGGDGEGTQPSRGGSCQTSCLHWLSCPRRGIALQAEHSPASNHTRRAVKAARSPAFKARQRPCH